MNNSDVNITVDDYDPFDPRIQHDPYPWYRALRDTEGCHLVEADEFYVVSRYEDVLEVLRQPRLFSSELGMGALMRGEISPRFARPRRQDVDIAALRVLIATDPPDHTTLRRLVGRGFTPRAIAQLEPRVRAIAGECLDQLLEAARSDEADLVRELAEPLPVLVIAELLGIPGERRGDFKRWSDDVVGVLSGRGDVDRAQASMAEMFEFFVTTSEERRRAPGDDLISALVASSEDGTLSAMEIVVFCVLLLIAGNETTTNLISNFMTVLFEHPDVEQRLRAEPNLIPAAVEEALRFDGPVQGLFRATREPARLRGTLLPANARVLVLFGSANRDGRQFSDPDRFVVERDPRDHVAFGAGIHLCLGAALARLEARVALETLLARTRAIAPRPGAARVDSFILRGFVRVPIAVDSL
jgi:cytochrome P450